MAFEIYLTVAFSAAAAFAICLLAQPVASRLGILDSPDNDRKLHHHVTPLVGGLAVIVPVLGLIPFLAVEPVKLIYLVLAMASAVTLLLGFVDDRRHIRPSLRLLLTVLIAIGSIYFVPDFELSFLRFSFLAQSFFLEGWSGVFSVLCLVGLLNAVNMADGKNGLVTGLSLIWCALLALYLPQHSSLLVMGLFACLSVVFFFNIQGRLFLGDSGSYALSMLFGLLAIYAYNINFAYIDADAIALWFLVPVLDCIRLMVSRVLQGRSPFSPDRAHLHHYLERVVPWRLGLPIYLGAVALPALLAYIFPDMTAVWLSSVVIVYVAFIALISNRKPLALAV